MKVNLPENFSDLDFENLENTMAFVSQEISSFSIDRNKKVIEIHLNRFEDTKNIEGKVQDLINKIHNKAPQTEDLKIIFSTKFNVPNKSDVFSQLLQGQQVIEHGPGLYSLHGLCAHKCIEGWTST
jgi:hypothetical protein